MTADIETVREGMMEALPTYMLPNVYVKLEMLPLNQNGKVDKKLLSNMEITPQEVERPQTEKEIQIADIWASLLHVDINSIGRHTSFFELGGDSISAIQLASKCSLVGIYLDTMTIFKKPTLSKLADCSNTGNRATIYKPVTIMSSVLDEVSQNWVSGLDGYAVYPASPLQSLMVARTIKDPNSYINRITWRLPDDFMLVKLQHAMQSVVQAHEILKARFVPTASGIFQIIPDHVEVKINLHSNLEKFYEEDLHKGFGSHDYLWFRISVIQNQSSFTHMILTIHHVLYDGWCMDFITNSIMSAYNGIDIAPSTPFHKVIEYIESQDVLQAENYWSKYLGDMVPDTQFHTSTVSSVHVEEIPVTIISEVTYSELERAASKQHTTISILAKAAWALTLRSYKQRKDIIFGYVVSGREIPLTGVESVVGMLMNSIPCRVSVASDETVKSLVEKLHTSYVSDIEFSHCTLTNIKKWSQQPSESSLFNTLFVFQNLPQVEKPHSTFTEDSSSDTLNSNFTEFDLQIVLTPDSNKLVVDLKYNWKSVNRNFVLDIAEHFQHYLTSVTQDCLGEISSKVFDIDQILPDEKEMLIKLGTGPKIDVKFDFAYQAFEEKVHDDPQVIAVEHFGRSITYGELNHKVQSLAYELACKGVTRGSFVGVITSRSIEMIIYFLAILKAGGAFVPIDSDLPKQRIENILGTANPSVVILHPDVDPELANLIDKNMTLVLGVDYPPIHFETVNVDKLDPAYVVFTSGSTGKPKGVVISHLSFNNFCNFKPHFIEVQKGVRVAQVASFGFDMGLQEIFCTLFGHGTLVLRQKDDFFAAVKTVDLLLTTPTTLLKMKPEDYPNIKRIVLGGEHLPQSLADLWSPKVVLINGYGPSEATMKSSATSILQTGDVVSIGRPLPNTAQYILDQNFKLVPRGVIGELVIGGDGVSLGYINRPDLTLERFISNHFMNNNTKMYRTGDICRWNESGNIEILGRIDDMVKVKGYRIELDEVAKAISSHNEVSSAVVLVKNDTLAAYITPPNIDLDSVRDKIIDILPSYMIPSSFVCLDTFPTNANGKVDKKALLEIELTEDVHLPTTKDELELAAIWSSLLNVRLSIIGRNTSFFALGGDSISAIQLVSRLKQIGWKTSSAVIFQAQTLKRLAIMKIDMKESAHNYEDGPISGDVMLTPIQKLFFNRELKVPNHFNQSMLFVPTLRVSPKSIESAVKNLANHHDMLRAKYTLEDGQWKQTIISMEEFDFPSIITGHVKTEIDLKEVIKQVQQSLSIETGKIFAYALFDFISEQRLFFTVHHLAVDLVSWRILGEDIESILLGRGLPPKTMSFQTWSKELETYSSTNNHMHKSELFAENTIQSLLFDGTSNEKLSYKVSLSKDVAFLLEKANSSYRTNIQELVLTALANSLALLDGVNKSLMIHLEGHGRETWNESIDISRTIGWFTAIFPVLLHVDGSNSTKSVREAKDQIRTAIPHSITYPSYKIVDDFLMVKFNYLGRFQAFDSYDTMFRMDSAINCEDVSIQNDTVEQILITCYHSQDGELILESTFNSKLPEIQIQKWLNSWVTTMTSLIMKLSSSSFKGGLTCSDFDLLPFGTDIQYIENEILSVLGQDLSMVEDIYPATPLQTGMIMTTMKDKSQYVVQSIWTFEGEFDLKKFKNAFTHVSEAFNTIRTTFVSTPDGILQVVFKEDLSNWDTCQLKNGETVSEWLTNILRDDRQEGFSMKDASLVRFKYLQIPDEKKTVILYSHHHALTDGWSAPILMNSILDAYGQQLVKPCLAYKKHIKYITEQDFSFSQAFWSTECAEILKEDTALTLLIENGDAIESASEYLDISLTELQIKDTLMKHNCTISTLIRTIWGLVLKTFTPGDSVIFGSVVSGRDTDIDDIERCVGLLINTIPVPMNINRDQPLSELISSLQQYHIASLPHSHVSLLDIKNWCGHHSVEQMFQSLLLFQNYPDENDQRDLPFTFTAAHGEEHVEYPLCVIAVLDKQTISYKVEYHKNKITANQLSRLLNCLKLVTEKVFDGQNYLINQILNVSESEKARLIELSTGPKATVPYNFVHEAFEDMVAQDSEVVAVEHAERSIT
ncbi:hypothetical protein BC833DRAFT_625943, partial [Globomyces pollinis-pini]